MSELFGGSSGTNLCPLGSFLLLGVFPLTGLFFDRLIPLLKCDDAAQVTTDFVTVPPTGTYKHPMMFGK